MSTCDHCGAEVVSEALVWVSSEDFEPKKGEMVPSDVYDYDALCEACYLGMLLPAPEQLREIEYTLTLAGKYKIG